jgi:F0F1-type ATP synthase assembly protein I
VTSANLFTTRATASSQTAVSANPDSAGQTAGQALYQQANQSPQPEAMVKRQFEQRNQSQKAQLANEFGREGIDRLAATPDGQRALAVVQSAGFVGGIGMGVIIGGAIALTPVGLVAGLVIGGIAAVGGDHFIKAGVEKVLGWFD